MKYTIKLFSTNCQTTYEVIQDVVLSGVSKLNDLELNKK